MIVLLAGCGAGKVAVTSGEHVLVVVHSTTHHTCSMRVEVRLGSHSHSHVVEAVDVPGLLAAFAAEVVVLLRVVGVVHRNNAITLGDKRVTPRAGRIPEELQITGAKLGGHCTHDKLLSGSCASAYEPVARCCV